MLRKSKLILTYGSGNAIESPTFWVFVNSFIKHIPNADLVVLTHDMNPVVRTKLENRGVTIVDVPAGEMYYLYRDRHLHFWKYLNEHGHKYEHVLITDSRDVVFQANPFDWIDVWKDRFKDIKGNKDFLNHFVVVMSEGFKRSQCGFACIEHFEFQRDVPTPHLKEDNDRWVCNAGVTLGTPRAIQDFEMLMFSVTMKTMGRCTDQATLNYLMYILDNDDAYHIAHPHLDNLCLTGEGVKSGKVTSVLSDGKLYNPKDQLYYIVHQWDRLEGTRDEIVKLYDV